MVANKHEFLRGFVDWSVVFFIPIIPLLNMSWWPIGRKNLFGIVQVSGIFKRLISDIKGGTLVKSSTN